MQLLTTVALAVAALSHLASATWTITPSNATQPEEIVGPHQTFVKVWTVTGSQSLNAIKLSAAGPVFIDYDASLNVAPTEAPTEAPTVAPTVAPAEAPTEAPTESPAATSTGSLSGSGLGLPAGVVSLDAVNAKVLAKIVFSGNCSKLLDELDVVEHQGALKVKFKNADFFGYGYLLTQVYVGEKEVLSEVTNSGSSSIHISESVISASNASAEVELKTSGDGDIFVTAPATAFAIKSLSTKISGAGSIQFSADSLTLGDALKSTVSGDGEIAVVAKSVDVNNTVSSKISGAGSIFVQAEILTTFKLTSKISGDGDITASTNGSCVTQEVSISGSGTIATGSIASVDTTVKLSGDGDVLVQTSHKLLVPHTIYSGTVQYVGTAPQEITDGRKPRPVTKKPNKPKHHRRHGWFSWGDDEDDDDDDFEDSHDYYDSEDDEHHLPKSVTQATENKYETYTLREPEAREPTFLVLEFHRNWWGDEPNARIIISIGGVEIGGSFLTNTKALAAASTQLCVACSLLASWPWVSRPWPSRSTS